ncbi:kinase-like protein [Rostrohypoxylon terebratum]|nr:kinase-like protein [Rostrohypoxylon terebratum]
MADSDSDDNQLSGTPESDFDYPITYSQEAQLASEQFSRWRRHGGRVGWSAKHVHKSREAWHKRTLPRPGQPLFFGGNRSRAPWKYKYFSYNLPSEDHQDLNFPYSFDNRKMERARKRVVKAVELFDKSAPKFKYKKTLGYGGLGVALHYQYVGDKPEKDVVVKLSLNSWAASDIHREADATKAMARAAHCIQLINPEDVGLSPQKRYNDIMNDVDSSSDEESSGDESLDESAAPPPRKPRKNLTPAELNLKKERRERRRKSRNAMTIDNTRLDYMLLEYVEGGNLLTLINKLCLNEDDDIPNRVLWQLWLCLVRACVAMKYPPRKFHPDRPKPSRPNGRTDLIETIPPPNKRWRQKNWVHFDIDPSNIFIGNIEVPPSEFDPNLERADVAQPDRLEGEHSFVPRLKLADFGLAKEVKTHKRDIYYSSRRQAGKPRCYAPEQFGTEWDAIPPVADGAGVSEQNVAGNYSSPMNVYQIGLTMWNIMTQLEQPNPIQPQVPLGIHPPRDNEGRIPANMDELLNTADPNVKISYCPLLLDPAANRFDKYDPELRRAIYECMYHRPSDRPTIEALLAQAEAGVQKQFEGETDEHVRWWVQRWILNATPPEEEEDEDVQMAD